MGSKSRCANFFAMALTGPEKAMYNFLIKREAAGNLNATQSKLYGLWGM